METDKSKMIGYPCEITSPAYGEIYPIKMLDLDKDKWLLEPLTPPKKKKKKKYKKLVKRIKQLEARVKKLEDIANTTSISEWVPLTRIDPIDSGHTSIPVRDN